VKPGEKFLLTENYRWETTIDESMISGEPIPVDKKKADDSVIAGTINGTNLVMVAEKLVRNLAANCANGNSASRSRAPIQNWPTEPLKYCANSSGSFSNHFYKCKFNS
jgi:Cu2+-exporting ATPase